VVLTQVPPQQPAQSQAELSDFVASAVAAGLQPVAQDFAAAFTQGQPTPLVWTSDRAPGGVVSSSHAAERNVKAEADMRAAAVERMVSPVLDMNAGQTLASSRLSGSSSSNDTAFPRQTPPPSDDPRAIVVFHSSNNAPRLATGEVDPQHLAPPGALCQIYNVYQTRCRGARTKEIEQGTEK
jgi:hypothetical protein